MGALVATSTITTVVMEWFSTFPITPSAEENAVGVATGRELTNLGIHDDDTQELHLPENLAEKTGIESTKDVGPAVGAEKDILAESEDGSTVPLMFIFKWISPTSFQMVRAAHSGNLSQIYSFFPRSLILYILLPRKNEFSMAVLESGKF